MRNFSISTFINLVFILAFSFITLSFLLFVKLDQEKYETRKTQRYSLIADSFLSGFQTFPSQEDLNTLYKKFAVSPIDKKSEKLNIINTAQNMIIQNTIFGNARVYFLDDDYYIYVEKLSYNILLKDLQSRPYNRGFGLLLFISSLFIFLLLFILIKRKFKPLKKLDQQIQQFADGNTNIKLVFNHDDEIGKIARSFNQAIININNLTKSKNLFMRNMMHELKTPITKAMFIAETLDDEKARDSLQKAFARMDNIIKELATVEKLTSNTNVLYKENTNFEEIYQKALSVLLVDNSKITADFKNFDLKVDISLFSIALKNLLDNGIKFSLIKHVEIKACKKEIIVSSKGEKLKYDLEYYTEPFSQEEKRKDGFGLGLYIVKTTAQLHEFSLEYKYEDEKNHFIIKMK